MSHDIADNIGFSIPIYDFKIIKDDMLNNNNLIINVPSLVCDFNNSDKYMLEFMNLHKNEDCKGYYIKKIYETSSLKKLVKEGDILCSFDGYEIDNYGECSVNWSEEKINLTDIFNRYKMGDNVSIKYYSFNKDTDSNLKEENFTFENKDYFKLKLIHYPFEKVDYEIFGGMVLMNLSLNHITNLEHSDIGAINSLNLQGYIHKKKRMKDRLFIAKILGGSYIKNIDVLQDGDIIKQINNIKIRNLDDFRKAIKKK